MGKVLAICRSDHKGTQKYQVDSAVLIADWGLDGDAHAGKWHRQVSLLGFEKIEAFRAKGAKVEFGAFGENLVVDGYDLRNIPVGSRIRIGECLLELTQIGKDCHEHCAIFHSVGDCIMPREGVFAVVLNGGRIKIGDAVEVYPPDPNHPYTAAVITLSDRAYAKAYDDKSGSLIQDILEKNNYEVIEYLLLPDERSLLQKQLIRLADQRQVNVIFTTGGTGFAKRDVTPEATEEVCDRMAPGISQAVLMKSLEITPKAMLSRQTAGIRKKTLIINLPGSPKACSENLEILLPVLGHGLGILRGTEDN